MLRRLAARIRWHLSILLPGRDARYRFTQNWFDWAATSWRAHLAHLIGQPALRFLEIGSFEGRSAVWLLNNVLTHPSSRLDCIDVFDGLYEFRGRTIVMSEVEARFDHNVRAAGANGRVTKLRGPSARMLRGLELDTYDFVYVDGSHVAADVLHDAVLAFPLLKAGGIMIFDDYAWEDEPDELDRPKPAIDAFLAIYQPRIDVLAKGYQVTLRKR